MNSSDLVEVKVRGVYMVTTPSGPAPVVLLSEDDRIMPIYIGISEAISIESALHSKVSPRPMTHDLIVSLLDSLGASVSEIVIDDLNEGIYYAQLILEQNGSERVIDARPSDCVALALRVESSILVRNEVLEDAAIDSSEIEDLGALDNYL